MSASPITFSDGKAYELLMGRWSRIAGEQFIDWLGAPTGLRWIDVGCGNGAFTEVLIARAAPAAVTGIDPSDGQIAYARSRPGAAMAKFQVGDAQSLPFADDSFDAASMALVIAFVDDAEQGRGRDGARGPSRRAGRDLYVVVPRRLSAALARAGDEIAGIEPGDAAEYGGGEFGNMTRYWQQAGLQSVETRVIRIQIAYADFDDFWQSATAPVGPSGKATSDLTPELREQLKARLRAMLPTEADGRIVYDAVANAVKGRVPA